LQLARIRQAAPRLRASLRGVGDYLAELAGSASAALVSVLAWAGLSLNTPVDARFGAGWGRLAQTLGLGAREAVLRLRLTVAGEVGQDLWPVLARTREVGRKPADLLAECEAFLAEAACHWHADARDRLSSSEEALWAAYRKAAGDAR
jgi:hypothetical protein